MCLTLSSIVFIVLFLFHCSSSCVVDETVQPIGCPNNRSATSSITNYMQCLYSYIRRADEMSNTIYDTSVGLVTDTNDWQQVVEEMLYVDDNCTDVVLSSLMEEYVMVIEIYDVYEERRYCVLHEKTTMCASSDPDVFRFSYGFGIVVVLSEQIDIETNIHLLAPHPLYDANTKDQALAVFRLTSSKSLLVAGAHRYANRASPNLCITSSNYGRTDATHTKDWGFHRASLAIIHYLQEQGCPLSSCALIQLHGKGPTVCSNVDVFISVGFGAAQYSYPDDISQPFYRIKRELSALTELIVKDPKEDECNLVASKNVQGRVLNGVEVGMECVKDATSPSGVFLHIEQSAMSREESFYELWAAALSAAF